MLPSAETFGDTSKSGGGAGAGGCDRNSEILVLRAECVQLKHVAPSLDSRAGCGTVQHVAK